MRLASDSLSVVRGCFQALTITVYYNLQTVPKSLQSWDWYLSLNYRVVNYQSNNQSVGLKNQSNKFIVCRIKELQTNLEINKIFSEEQWKAYSFDTLNESFNLSQQELEEIQCRKDRLENQDTNKVERNGENACSTDRK